MEAKVSRKLLDQRLIAAHAFLCDAFEQQGWSCCYEVSVCKFCGALISWEKEELPELEALAGRGPFALHLVEDHTPSGESRWRQQCSAKVLGTAGGPLRHTDLSMLVAILERGLGIDS